MATIWTEEQKEAIENRGGTLLVSAAAGSGKTAVLVERVLRRLTDGQDPVNIDSFLMVTYTNAAAAELRGKIADALSARLVQNMEDARLRRQLMLVHHAQITTVHAFCLNLAREEFAALGVAPDFRIADTNESDLLMDEVLDMVLEEFYESADPDFLSLSDLLAAGRDDKRLHQTVLETYEKIQAHPRPEAYLEQARQVFMRTTGNLAHTAHGAVLLQEAQLATAYGLSCLQEAIDILLQGDEQVQDAYLPAFLSDKARAEELLNQIKTENWDGAVALVQGLSFDKLKSVRGYEDKAYLESLKALRDEWKGVVKKVREKYLCVTEIQAEQDRLKNAPAMGALITLTERFTHAFMQEKRRRNLVDFSDLEHFAVSLLTDTNGDPTALAQTLSARYTEVLVDEYQDTNAVQDAIFRAVSANSRKLFMVGDVKQSIYSFRLANPYIFLSKYRAFADASQVQEGQPRRVVLSKNFRSRPQVLESVNTIFRAVMSQEVGDLDYDAREMLYAGATFPEAQNPAYRTEVCVIDCAKDAEGQTPDRTVCEARVIAQRIAEMISSGFSIFDKALGKMRTLAPSDCTILLRSVKQKAVIYQQALEEAGLSARTDNQEGLLTTTEVRVIVSLLNIIDNPRQDIELIGTMRSPLFGFTEQQLADIRLYDKKVCFYEALQLAAEDGDAAASAFLSQLLRWRELAADVPVYQLLQRLYDETGALGVYGAQPNGAQRQANLLAFFERARAYEAQGYRGLFRFMNFVRGMLENGEDFSAVQNDTGGGAVRIMSIHKSKGLEFPVVFLAGCAKSFNESDLYAPVLIHETLGFGPKCRDIERGIQYLSLQRLAIAAQARRQQISEEMRILYVGMTRARDKLVVTCASGSAVSSLKKWARLAAREQIPPYALAAARTTALWLLTPLLRHPAAAPLREFAEISLTPDTSAEDCFTMTCINGLEIEQPEKPTMDTRDITEGAVLEMHTAPPYPYVFLQDIPAKLTATTVKAGFKAEETMEGTKKVSQQKQEFRRPYFDLQKRGLTASERGTAHHLFMQFCDFEACTQPDGIEREKQRLQQAHILTQEQIEAIQTDKIAAFFTSSFYHKMLQTGQIRREFKFSILAPAGQFYPEAQQTPEETVLLQGVIDCLIETPHGYMVIDYKTDHVNATNVKQYVEKYRSQLEVYAYAVQQIFQRPVQQKVLYFFSIGKYVVLS